MESKKDTNEFIYKTETDSQTQKTDLWLPKVVGGINWEPGINIHILSIYKRKLTRTCCIAQGTLVNTL